MMRYYLLLFLLISINLHAQNDTVVKSNKYRAKAVAMFREVFWNNLPKPVHWTNDYEDLYTDAQQHKLDSIITAFEKKTSFEIAIVTIDTVKTSNEKFEDLTLHIAKKWGVGKTGKNNGILIGISKGYKRIGIQNGIGIEKIISNQETGDIIDNYFIPGFRKDDYYEGTLNGLMAIIKLLEHKMGK